MYSIFERLMNEAGETHYQVAKATGVSQSTLSDWKLGKTTPRNPTLKKLADHYGVSVSYLKGETAEKTAKEKPADQVADGLNKYDMLNEENRAAIDSLIDRLLASQSGE